MPASSLEKLFLSIVEQYKSGKCTKKQTLKKLEDEYKSALIDIKKELHDNFEIFRFHQYASCDIDTFIEACERSENSLSPSERDDFAQLISRAVQGVKKDCEDTMEKGPSYSLALQSVYYDVDKIRELCRKNRETKELYEKCKVEIEAVPDKINQEARPELTVGNDIPQQISEQLDTPEKIQEKIDATLAFLLKEDYIKRVKCKDGFEYHITKTISKIKAILKISKMQGNIELPEIDKIDDFIIAYLKSRKGNPLLETVRMANSREKKKNRTNTN